MAHRNLAAFARWFLAQPLSALRPPVDATFTVVTTGGRVEGMLLYRDAPYQVELFNAPRGGGHFPPHRHPNVDSIEYLLSGQIGFHVAGRAAPVEDVFAVAADGAAKLCGTIVRIRPSDWHGADVGPAGGVFLSIQRWLNGVPPSSVVLDWEGPPHLELRRAQSP